MNFHFTLQSFFQNLKKTLLKIMLLKSDLLMSQNESVDLNCEVYEVKLICSQPNNSRKTQPLSQGYIIQVCTTCVLLHYLHSFYNFPAFSFILHLMAEFYNYLSAVGLIERNKRTSTQSSLGQILLSKQCHLMKTFWSKIKQQIISVLSINICSIPTYLRLKINQTFKH